MNAAVGRSPQSYALVGGVIYLAIIVLGATGELFIRESLVVSGDPAATAKLIAASPMLWRAGIAGDLLMHVLDVPLIVILYLLLRPVSPGLSLFAAAANVVQTAILAANKLTLLLPLFLRPGPTYLQAFTPAQLDTLAYLAIKAHQYGFAIGLILFGIACMVRGPLMARSGYFPKWLGYLILVVGICYLVNSFAMLAAPALAAAISPAILAPPLVGELSMSLWLIFKGVDGEGWKRRTPA